MADYYPERIIQILCGSRSGSTYLKKLLSSSPGVTTTLGEDEPYWRHQQLGYNGESGSDVFQPREHNIQSVKKRILRELDVNRPVLDRIEDRLRLQYEPEMADWIMSRWNERYTVRGNLLDLGLGRYYDGLTNKTTKSVPFDLPVRYEMPPFVLPEPCHDVKSTLLLKNPHNAVRGDLIRQMWSDLPVYTVHLVRHPGAIIQGLMDGWNSPYGFHKYLTPFGWWKFEMFSTWKDYVRRPLVELCYQQWKHSFIGIQKQLIGKNTCTIRFEDLITTPKITVNKLRNDLGINPQMDTVYTPIMTSNIGTGVPKFDRWKDNIEIVNRINSQECQDLISGYYDA